MNLENEKGLALIMTVFVVALATILVLDFSGETLRYQRQCRMFQERIQADLMLKSAIGLSQALIEFPKLPGYEEDWVGDAWSTVSSQSELPIPGLIGEPKITIVDESSKINLNNIASPPGSAAGVEASWREVVLEIFNNLGFADEDYPPEEARTLGNKGFNAENQIAAIIDWIDADKVSFNDPNFKGLGIEAEADKKWFFNRPLTNISELALIPGMTLERLNRLSKYVKVSPNFYSKININTVTPEVLLAIGFDTTRIQQIIEIRAVAPIQEGDLDLELSYAGNPSLSQSMSVNSQEFSAYVKITMPNVTRWARAIFSVQGSGLNRTATRNYLEVM